MKIISGILFASSLLFANSSFIQNTEYACLNTIIVENGQKKEVEFQKSFDRPFHFTLKGKQLITVNKVVFDMKMEKEGTTSYSNDNFVLLLMKDNELGLVPKKSKGQVQYFFKCKKVKD